MRVLIVEDDIDLAESIADVLSIRGYELEIASNAESAEQKYDDNPFDLVFMDVKLPGLNGVDAFERIRATHPEARVVMMTGFGEGDLIQRALNGGALGVLNKPFRMDRMIEILEKHKQV